ncbi:MAG: tetratricopeptide repeat protein, partial [Phycisphaerales bacterium]|nr:tetratricopeptide repeat protein [Phycisphaerales bacterium]
MTRNSDWFRWIMMAVLACVAVYFFLFANQGAPLPPVPTEGQVKDPVLANAINKQIQSVNQSPADLGMRLQLCMIYDANGLETLAFDCYDQLTELIPEHPRAWYHLALLHKRQDNPEQAMIAMTQAASATSDAQFANWQLGQMQLDAGQSQEAVNSLEKAREQLGSMPAFQVTLMRAHIEAGNPQKAIEIVESTSVADSNIGPYAQSLAAQAYDQLGDADAAAQARSLANDLAPTLRDSWMVEVSQHRADIHALKARIAASIQSQKWAEAINMIDLLRQFETPTRDIELMEVTCLAQTGSPELGLQKVQQMLAEEPDDQQLILAEAAMKIQIGDLRNDPD